MYCIYIHMYIHLFMCASVYICIYTFSICVYMSFIFMHSYSANMLAVFL